MVLFSPRRRHNKALQWPSNLNESQPGTFTACLIPRLPPGGSCLAVIVPAARGNGRTPRRTVLGPLGPLQHWTVFVLHFAVGCQEMNCMLHNMEHITPMARGESGRIVVEVDPELKRRLYAALSLSGSSLKDWFLKEATQFCADASQLRLFEQSGSAAPSDSRPAPLSRAEETQRKPFDAKH